MPFPFKLSFRETGTGKSSKAEPCSQNSITCASAEESNKVRGFKRLELRPSQNPFHLVAPIFWQAWRDKERLLLSQMQTEQMPSANKALLCGIFWSRVSLI